MRILAERGVSKVAKFLEQREFESMEEVNRALETANQQRLFDETSGTPDGSPLTPLEQAQELAYDALEATGRRRIKLARRALTLSPDCAAACIVLGEAAATPEAALDWYQRGVEAGERAIGSAHFADGVGQFWGLIGTRPYMRARLALAETLRTLGRIDEALDHYKELLRLNPDDNQGVRYLLLPALLECGRDDEAGVLLANYADDIQAIWPYGRALWLFRTHGDSAAARSALHEAKRTNPHVVRFLLDPEALPWSQAPSFTLGSREEAAYAAGELCDAFEKTSGALEWIGQRASDPRTRRKKR
jgi:tetratricopeptide (TPR) repeat protein